jgi:hypothetical protein
MVPRQLLTAFAVCAITLSPKLADACSCIGASLPCDAAGRADAVFVGHVVSIESSGVGGRVAQFAIVEAFRGLQLWQVTLSDWGQDNCAYPFQMGESYLVYAIRSRDGHLSTSICARTRPVADAAEELTYLRSLATIVPGTSGRLAGRVQLYEPWRANRSELKPVPGVTVIATGEARTFTGKANDGGEFELTGLPLGKYDIIAKAPEGYESTVRPVDIHDPRGCGTTTLWVQYDGRVIGRVVDSRGEGIQGLPLELIAAADLEMPSTTRRVQAWTAADGTFEMRLVPPGEYLLSLEAIRSREGQAAPQRVLYPGVAGSAGAGTISVSTAARVRLGNFAVPGNLSLVTVSGVIVDDGGRPVRDASIFLSRGDLRIGWMFATGEDGRFMFTVPEGRGYVVHATRYVGDSSNRETHTAMVPFAAAVGTPALTVAVKPQGY